MLWIGVSRKFHLYTLDTYVVVAKILQNGAKFSYKKAGFKNYRNLIEKFQTSIGKSKNLKFDGLLSKTIHSFS